MVATMKQDEQVLAWIVTADSKHGQEVKAATDLLIFPFMTYIVV